MFHQILYVLEWPVVRLQSLVCLFFIFFSFILFYVLLSLSYIFKRLSLFPLFGTLIDRLRLTLYNVLCLGRFAHKDENMKFAGFVISLLFLAWGEVLALQAVMLPNFYPFGESEGDQVVPRGDDDSSGSVPISIPLPFFGQNYTSLFVSTTFL